ncbi:MAG: hypothetical protein ACRD10_05715 [Terriglobia bacterium]
MNRSAGRLKKHFEVRAKWLEWPKRKPAQAEDASTAVKQFLSQAKSDGKASSDQRNTAAAVEEHVVHFLQRRVPKVTEFAHGSRNVPDQPAQDQHTNNSTLHA